MTESLQDSIPSGLAKKLRAILANGETVEVQLKGVWKEVLVCTDRRVLILKSGFMTGQLFGSNVFQVPYSNVSGVDVKFHLLTGYFELSTGGMQNTAKSYWAQSANANPGRSPNCVTLNSRAQAARFRLACSAIMERVAQLHRPAAPAQPLALPTQDNPADAIERLWKLRTDGAISQEEYEAMKQRVVTG